MRHGMNLSITRMLSMFVIVAMGMSTTLTFGIGTPSLENAAAQDGDDYVRVGWTIDMAFWNPLTIQNTADWTSILNIYSTLFMYHESYDSIVGNLATDYYQVVEPSGEMSTFINITKNGYFRNSANPEDMSNPLTAFDIEYTLDLIMTTTGNMWEYYLYNVTDVSVTDDGAAWDYSRTDRPYQVRIDTEFTKATLIDDLTYVPILPKYVWEEIPTQDLLGRMKPAELIGSGPFCFNDMAQGQWYEFNTAPNYHGTADYGEERDIDIDGVRYTVYTDMTALAIAMNQGDEDVIDITGAQTSVWDYVGGNDATVNVIKQVTNELGAIDIAINAIPLEFRTKDYAEGGNKILLDDVVRKAIGMTLNKEELVTNYFDGLPTIADTMINPGYWHVTPPDLLPYNPVWARENLTNAGYADLDGDGYLEVTVDSLAYAEGWANVGDRLEFRLHVPDSDPTFATVGSAWVSWAREAGIKLNFEVYSAGYMTTIEWYKLDYDIWVWSWYWTPEPLASLMCWRTDMMFAGGWNCVGPIGEWWWVDEENKIARSEYDDVFDEAIKTTDRDQRRDLVFELQTLLYDSWTEFPPFYPVGLYAMTDQKYEGWGDWANNLGRTVISCLPWLWFDLEVVVNRSPVFNEPPEESYTAYLGMAKEFVIEVSDAEGDSLDIEFDFGDGSAPAAFELTGDTTVPTTVTASHIYDTAVVGLTLTVTMTDNFEGRVPLVRTATVNVYTEYNAGPILSLAPPNPLPPVYVGTEVEWSATASDAESETSGYGLNFTWSWGDGTYAVDPKTDVPDDTDVTSTQTKTWSMPGTYYVKVSVWDGFGEESDPDHNVSVTFPFEVIINEPPTDPVIQAMNGLVDVALTCMASSSDPEGDELKFTWEWDDGTFTVDPRTPTGPDVPVTSTVTHTWDAEGTYPVTVYVDDGMGNNATASRDAVIMAEGNVPPGSFALDVIPMPLYAGELATFDVSASDANEDVLTVTIDFGDDSPLESADTEGGTTESQHVGFTHAYDETGTYEVTVWADDGAHNESALFYVVVSEPAENKPPVLLLQSSYQVRYNETRSFKPAMLYDPDGDPMTVWYDWGDETPMTLGDPVADHAASHRYTAIGNYTLRVYADDGMGNNATASAPVKVVEGNLWPSIDTFSKWPAMSSYKIAETIMFNVTVSDLEGDTVLVRIEFGDGETDDRTVILTAKVPTTVTFTHEYESSGNFVVNVTATDMMDHSDPTVPKKTMTVVIDKEVGISIAIVAGIVILAVIIIAVVIWMMSRRKGSSPSGTGLGGMEGMSPEEAGETGPRQTTRLRTHG